MKKNKLNPKIWQNDMPDLNDDLMWANIENALDENKSKPVFFYWLSAALILIIIGFSIVLLKDNNSSNISKNIQSDKRFSNLIVPKVKETKKTSIKTLTTSNISEDNESKSETDIISKRNTKRIIKNNLKNNFTTSNINQRITFTQSNNSLKIQSIDLTKKVNIENNNEQIHTRIIKSISAILNHSTLVFYSRRDISINQTKLNFMNKKGEIIKEAKRKYFILGYAGIGAPISNAKYDDKILWQKRKFDNEKALYNYSFSLELAKPIYYNFFVSAGINYNNIVVNYFERDSATDVEYFESDSAYVIRNTTVYLSGERTKTTITTKELSYYNNISHWSIPINFGYQWSKNKSNFMLSAGFLIRFNSKFVGKTVLPDGKIGKYENNKNVIEKHLGISQVNISTYYTRALSNNFDLLLGVRGAVSLQPDYTINSIFSKKYSSINFITGFKYRL